IPFHEPGRWQFLIDRSLLAGLGPGWRIREIWFRRDVIPGLLNDDCGRGTIDLRLDWSTTDTAANAPDPRFDANHRTPRGTALAAAFAGTPTLPDCTPPATAPAPWSHPYAIQLPLTAPILDLGGNLCLDFTMRAVNGQPLPDHWPVDCEFFPVASQAQEFGQA